MLPINLFIFNGVIYQLMMQQSLNLRHIIEKLFISLKKEGLSVFEHVWAVVILFEVLIESQHLRVCQY